MGKLFTRRSAISLGILGGGAATMGYTVLVEPFHLEFVHQPMLIPHLPKPLVGKTLMQISDLHAGGRVRDDYLIGSLQEAASLRPDIIVYTGDFITLDDETEAAIGRVFPHLPLGRLGTAAILGNHDYGVNWTQESWALKIISSLALQGIPVLRNEALEISGLKIIGMDDLWAEKFDPLKALHNHDPATPAIALSHNPDTVDREGWSAFHGWILSGHTHGGQCKPPFLPPPLLPVVNKRYSAGLFQLAGNRRLYINRALGYLHQVRFNVRPEITIFHLA